MIDVAEKEPVVPDCLPPLVPQSQAWAICGLTRAQWYKLRSEKRLPDPIILYERARPMWRRADLLEWVASRPRDLDWLTR